MGDFGGVIHVDIPDFKTLKNWPFLMIFMSNKNHVS